MMSFKTLSLFLLISSQSVFASSSKASEADWEVINLALDNINAANPTVLANSVVRILSGFLPADATYHPSSTTSAPVTSAPITHPPVKIIVDQVTQAPHPVQPATNAPASPDLISQLLLLYPGLYQQLIHGVPQPAPVSTPASVQQHPTITQILTPSKPSCDCDCKKKPNALAEFLVNVPCPTTTEKPPKRIVVKVPCPTTTTTTTEKPSCQCCACNPSSCPPSKPHKPHKPHKPEPDCESESEESKEIKYKAYAIPKKSNSVRHYVKYDEDCSSEESH